MKRIVVESENKTKEYFAENHDEARAKFLKDYPNEVVKWSIECGKVR